MYEGHSWLALQMDGTLHRRMCLTLHPLLFARAPFPEKKNSFFCGIVIPYIAFGMLFMRFRKVGGRQTLRLFTASPLAWRSRGLRHVPPNQGASGTEMIPNRDLWIGLPGLIAAGFKFTWGKITGKSSTYEQI